MAPMYSVPCKGTKAWVHSSSHVLLFYQPETPTPKQESNKSTPKASTIFLQKCRDPTILSGATIRYLGARDWNKKLAGLRNHATGGFLGGCIPFHIPVGAPAMNKVCGWFEKKTCWLVLIGNQQETHHIWGERVDVSDFV